MVSELDLNEVVRNFFGCMYCESGKKKPKNFKNVRQNTEVKRNIPDLNVLISPFIQAINECQMRGKMRNENNIQISI